MGGEQIFELVSDHGPWVMLVFFLLWAECTNLAREIAIAAAGATATEDSLARLRAAEDPEALTQDN